MADAVAETKQEAKMEEMQQQMEQMQAQQVAAAAAAPATNAAAPAGASDDMVGQLNQMAQLHQSGALSDEEYATAKARILG